MPSKRLAKSLLTLDKADGSKSTAELAETVLKRDRYRLRWMTELAVLLWLLAAIGAIWIARECWVTIHFIARSMERDAIPDHTRFPFMALTSLMVYAIAAGGISLFLMITAGLSTIVLMYQSRHATLRQINSNLQRISEELEQMQLAKRKEEGTPPR